MKKIATLIVLALIALSAFGEDYKPSGSVYRASQAPDDVGYQKATKIDSATVTYVCTAPSRRKESASLTVTTISNANPGVMTITSHGFNASATPVVYISGATGNWTPINGQHVLTYSSANAMAIDVDTTSFGAWGAQSITVTTFAVRESDTLWSIQKIVYDGTPAEIWRGWAAGAKDANRIPGPPDGGSGLMRFACASRTTYGYE